jgi:hypothetical protein
MSGGAVKLLSGPAGYAVPLIVGAVLAYLVYRSIKAPVANYVASVTPGEGQSTLNYLFGIGNPYPNANPAMGGPNFGVIDKSGNW